MNAKEYLEQAFRLEQRVQSKLDQIERFRSLAAGMSSTIGQEPVTHTRNNAAMQDAVVRIMEAVQELNAEIDELVDLKQEIKLTIALVPDATLRLVLEKRNLCFLKWDQIALEMNYSLSSVHEKYRKAVMVVQEIIDGRETRLTG